MMLDVEEAEDVLKKLREEIELLIPYAVPADDLENALGFLETYKEDQFALYVIKDFYRTLPDAREESLLKISMVEEKEQVFLLLLSTAKRHHLYLTNDEEGLFLGEWEQGVRDKQVLSFFDYSDIEAFKRNHPKMEDCREYEALERLNEEICPSCGVRAGTIHTLGCPVEVCPWCGGQLNHCNCRFEQLDVVELSDGEMLTKLEEKLDRKGRVPYTKDQRPTFMKEGASKEVIFK